MPTENQKRILRLFCKPGICLRKRDIVKVLDRYYFCNADKYVGEILRRMVKNGVLERVETGVYRLGTGGNLVKKKRR